MYMQNHQNEIRSSAIVLRSGDMMQSHDTTNAFYLQYNLQKILKKNPTNFSSSICVSAQRMLRPCEIVQVRNMNGPNTKRNVFQTSPRGSGERVQMTAKALRIMNYPF